MSLDAKPVYSVGSCQLESLVEPWGACVAASFAHRGGNPRRFLDKYKADASASAADLIIAAVESAASKTVALPVVAASVRVFWRSVYVPEASPGGICLATGFGEVCTHPDHRRRGLASRCLIAASQTAENALEGDDRRDALFSWAKDSTHRSGVSSRPGPAAGDAFEDAATGANAVFVARGICVLHAASTASALYARLGFKHIRVRKCLLRIELEKGAAMAPGVAATDSPGLYTLHQSFASIDELSHTPCIFSLAQKPGAAPQRLRLRVAESGEAFAGSAEAAATSTAPDRVPDDITTLCHLRNGFTKRFRLCGVHLRSPEHWRRYVLGWKASGRVVLLEAEKQTSEGARWVGVAYAIGLSKRGRASLGEYGECDTEELRDALGDTEELRDALGDTEELRDALGDTEELRDALGGLQVADDKREHGLCLPGELYAALVTCAVSLAVSLDPDAEPLVKTGRATVTAPLCAVPRLAAAHVAADVGDEASVSVVEHSEASDDGWMYRPLVGLACAAVDALDKTSSKPNTASSSSSSASMDEMEAVHAKDASMAEMEAVHSKDGVRDTMSLIEEAAESYRHVVWDVDGF